GVALHILTFAPLPHDPRPPRASAVNRFDSQRETELVGKVDDVLRRLDGVCCSGGEGTTNFMSNVAGFYLIAQCINGRRRRTNPDDSGIDNSLSELGIFCQKAIAWVNGVGTGILSRPEHLIY